MNLHQTQSELANNELVTVEVKVIEDVALKILWVLKIIVSVVADDNVGILDNILQINQSCLVSQGIKREEKDHYS